MTETAVLLFLTGAIFGLFVGKASVAADWRMSADSHHHSHKSGGRWFKVFPVDWAPDCIGPVCGQQQYGSESWKENNSCVA